MTVRIFCQENRKLEVSMCQLDPKYNFKNVKNIKSGSFNLFVSRFKARKIHYLWSVFAVSTRDVYLFNLQTSPHLNMVQK